jgi:hypothetical protein
VHDKVTVAKAAGTPASVAAPTGTVTFTLYANNSCDGTNPADVLNTWTVSLSSGIAETPDVSLNPSSTQSYSYRAHYNGNDPNNPYPARDAACEPFTVTASPPGKSVLIGPASMEGSLNIKPGDWISGGYHFKIGKSHPATTETVTGPAGGFPQITIPVKCVGGPFDGQTKNIVFGLTKPGQSYAVAAGYTGWTPPDPQQQVGVFMGSAQAPDLCGGAIMKSQVGATFQAVFAQSPQVGVTTVQFHYRDPNAKGQGNINCADPTVNNGSLGAAVCGASWSPTVDP